MHTSSDLRANPHVRTAVSLLREAGLSADTIDASLNWLAANEHRVDLPPKMRVVQRNHRVASVLVTADGSPRASYSDRPEWYRDEWAGWIPEMHDANVLVKSGASELSLHALAIMRVARKHELAERRRKLKARDSARHSAEYLTAREGVRNARASIKRQSIELSRLEAKLVTLTEVQRWAQEPSLAAARQRLERTRQILSAHEHALSQSR